EAELEGFTLIVEKWLARYEKEIQENHEVLVQLDEEFRRLRNIRYFELEDTRDILHISNGIWDRPRIRNKEHEIFNPDGSTDILDLFGDTMNKKLLTGTKLKQKKYPNNI